MNANELETIFPDITFKEVDLSGLVVLPKEQRINHHNHNYFRLSESYIWIKSAQSGLNHVWALTLWSSVEVIGSMTGMS